MPSGIPYRNTYGIIHIMCNSYTVTTNNSTVAEQHNNEQIISTDLKTELDGTQLSRIQNNLKLPSILIDEQMHPTTNAEIEVEIEIEIGVEIEVEAEARRSLSGALLSSTSEGSRP